VQARLATVGNPVWGRLHAKQYPAGYFRLYYRTKFAEMVFVSKVNPRS
jgi:hypothetical protein